MPELINLERKRIGQKGFANTTDSSNLEIDSYGALPALGNEISVVIFTLLCFAIGRAIHLEAKSDKEL